MKDRNIICLANTTWEGTYVKSTVKLFSELAKSNRILFVEYPFTYKDMLLSLFGKQIAPVSRMLGFKSRIVEKKTPDGEPIYLLTVPPTFPAAFIKNLKLFKRVLNLNGWLIKRSIARAIRKLNFSDVININAYNPFFGLPLLSKFNEQSTIYYCYDAINVRRFGANGPIVEEDFIKGVDGIITTSDNLLKKKIELNPNGFAVKNGVDFKTFNKIVDIDKPFTSKRKVVGYIGSVDRRFEVDMIAWVIEQLPEVDFEFVGRTTYPEGRAKLEKYPNVVFKPPVRPDEVPAIMYNCHVGIIPYARTPGNKNIYPLKINEYLAVGTPVVMTDFADLPEFTGIVSVATNKEDFLDGIKFEIGNDSTGKKKERIKLASANSWEGRGREFSIAIQKIIDIKETKRSES